MLVHVFLINEQVGAFKKRNEDAEDREAPLFLLFGQILRRAIAPQQVQVGIIKHELEEFAVLVGEALEKFLLLTLPFLALLKDEHDDRKRKCKRIHDIEHHFAILEQGHDGNMIT